MRAGDDLATLEVGKLADIVLLDANPLEDIMNTQTIWRVIKGGGVFDPEELRPDVFTSHSTSYRTGPAGLDALADASGRDG